MDATHFTASSRERKQALLRRIYELIASSLSGRRGLREWWVPDDLRNVVTCAGGAVALVLLAASAFELYALRPGVPESSAVASDAARRGSVAFARDGARRALRSGPPRVTRGRGAKGGRRHVLAARE